MPTTNTIAPKANIRLKHSQTMFQVCLAGMSLRDSASIRKNSHKTAFYWRHKVMVSLNDVLEEKLTLQNIVEADEVFFPVCYKGNHNSVRPL